MGPSICPNSHPVKRRGPERESYWIKGGVWYYRLRPWTKIALGAVCGGEKNRRCDPTGGSARAQGAARRRGVGTRASPVAPHARVDAGLGRGPVRGRPADRAL